MNISIVIASLLFVAGAQAVEECVENPCPENYIFNERTKACYRLQPDDITNFDQAADTCIHEGGSLASVHDKVEDAFLAYLAASKDIDHVFLGFHKAAWSDNSEMIYDNEAPGQNTDIECMAMGSATDLSKAQWTRVDCDEEHAFVCKIPLEVCPACECMDRSKQLVPKKTTCGLICNELESGSKDECEACCGCCSSDDEAVKCTAFGYSELVQCLTRPVFDRMSYTGGVMAHCPGSALNMPSGLSIDVCPICDCAGQVMPESNMLN